MATVFISYSHQDQRWLDRLLIHLKPLERHGSITADVWADTRISAGGRWRDEIRRAIESAQVAVLLVSADFLASDFIASEELPPLLEAAEERGVNILPVVISPCRYEQTQTISHLQSVNDPRKPLTKLSEAEQDDVFVKLSTEIELAHSRPLTEFRDTVSRKLEEVSSEQKENSGCRSAVSPLLTTRLGCCGEWSRTSNS